MRGYGKSGTMYAMQSYLVGNSDKSKKASSEGFPTKHDKEEKEKRF